VLQYLVFVWLTHRRYSSTSFFTGVQFLVLRHQLHDACSFHFGRFLGHRYMQDVDAPVINV
jgi:hypothetical protein